MRYQGEQDGGSFRAILWVVGPEQFKLRAVDPLGRALWGLALQGESVHLVNYRDKTECRASGSVVISSVVLENLPIGELPVVLSGRLPASLRLAQTTADGRLVDESGQTWSVVQDGSEILKWTLWGDNGPLLWFQRVDNGGILSHRKGGQFRWRETLREVLSEIPGPLARPDGVREVACSEIATRGNSGS